MKRMNTDDFLWVLIVSLLVVSLAAFITGTVMKITKPKEITMTICTDGFDPPEDYFIPLTRCEGS